MKLSIKGEYACLALIHLTEQYGKGPCRMEDGICQASFRLIFDFISPQLLPLADRLSSLPVMHTF
jgi:hypothetical protein